MISVSTFLRTISPSRCTCSTKQRNSSSIAVKARSTSKSMREEVSKFPHKMIWLKFSPTFSKPFKTRYLTHKQMWANPHFSFYFRMFTFSLSSLTICSPNKENYEMPWIPIVARMQAHSKNNQNSWPRKKQMGTGRMTMRQQDKTVAIIGSSKQLFW